MYFKSENLKSLANIHVLLVEEKRLGCDNEKWLVVLHI